MAKKNGGINTGVAIAALVAAAGAAFVYASTGQGKKHAKKIKGWTLKAKGEVLEKLENAKDVSEDTYKDIVEKVSENYKKLKKIEGKEMDLFVKEMKSHWNRIRKEIKDSEKKTAKKKPSKAKSAKKATKKTSKKS